MLPPVLPAAPRETCPKPPSAGLESSAFSSGLTVPDFAACLELGLEPVALVQGFCVMQWGWYGPGSGYMRGMTPYSPACPRAPARTARRTAARTATCPWSTAPGARTSSRPGWSRRGRRATGPPTAGWSRRRRHWAPTASSASSTGCPTWPTPGPPSSTSSAPRSPSRAGRRRRAASPWTTYLAGQRLTKSIEAGFMPVEVVAALASVRVWAYCMTEYLMEGTMALGRPAGTPAGGAGRPRRTWRSASWPASTCASSWPATSCTAP